MYRQSPDTMASSEKLQASGSMHPTNKGKAPAGTFRAR